MPVAKLVVNEAMAVNIKLTICRLLLLFGSLWQLPPERLSTVFYLYRRHCVIDLLFSIGVYSLLTDRLLFAALTFQGKLCSPLFSINP